MRSILGQFFFGNAEGFAHTDNLVGRQCAGTETALVAATVHLSFEADAWFTAYIQGADAFRAVYFVAGHRQQINFGGFNVDRYFAACLCCVNVENDFAFAADFADGRNILNHADFVVYPHYGNEDGVFADSSFQYL